MNWLDELNGIRRIVSTFSFWMNNAVWTCGRQVFNKRVPGTINTPNCHCWLCGLDYRYTSYILVYMLCVDTSIYMLTCLSSREVRFRAGLRTVNARARDEVHHSAFGVCGVCSKCLTLLVSPDSAGGGLGRARVISRCSCRLPAAGAVFVFLSKVPMRLFVRVDV